MSKFFVGDIVKLFGKTRHGKNRIRENGDMWRVITVDGQDSTILPTKICVRPMDLDRRDNWRWIDLPDDEHMTVNVVEIEVPEHVRDENRVDDIRERIKEIEQRRMFDDETWNWSGLR